MDALAAIHARRSIKKLISPAPSDDELRVMLDAAVSAPDHKELQPWRFIVLRNEHKDAFGDVMAKALLTREPSATRGQIDKERHKLDRAPLVVVAAAKRVQTDLAFEEVLAATAAATQNLLLAVTALGYGAMWRTGVVVYDATIKRALGLEPEDAIVGFIYVGTPASAPDYRPPRDASVVTEWEAGLS